MSPTAVAGSCRAILLLFLFVCSIVEAYVSQTRPSLRYHSTYLQHNTSSTSSPRICILGGGFAGIHVALTLSSLFQHGSGNPSITPQITLIDRKERFVFLPLLYELCVGDATLEEVAPTYRSLLQGSNVDFVQGSIQGVDIDTRRVYLSQKKNTVETFVYDALVVATGADSADFTQIPGAKETVVPFYTIEDCYHLRRILSLFESNLVANNHYYTTNSIIKVVVVGGGYSGVELSLNVLQRLNKIASSVKNKPMIEMTLIHRGKEVLGYTNEYNRKMGLDRVQQAGIRIMTQTTVDAIVPKPSRNHLFSFIPSCQVQITRRTIAEQGQEQEQDSTSIDADLVIWTAGAMRRNLPNIPGILNSKIPRDTQGRIVTDECLFVRGHKFNNTILALGDCSRVIRRPPSLPPFPSTAQVAMQQATVAAWNLYSSLLHQDTGVDLIPFEFLNLGEMMSLGSEDASISSFEGLLQLNGVSASVVRRWIYALRMPTPNQAWFAWISSFKSRTY